jgi:hypothetical protein
MGVASDYRALAKRYRSLPEEMVRAGAAEMSQAILTNLKADTGGDQRLSGFTRRPGAHPKMAVTTKISPGTRISTATIEASPRRFRGMWSILESGTAERIVGQLTRKTTGPGGKHMKVGSDWHTGPWSAGSSPAKRTFSEGVLLGGRDADRAMTRVWDGVA